MLNKVNPEELIFPLDSDMDTVCTDILLSDYDWMQYIVSTKLTTEATGELKIVWKYCGMTSSNVYIIQVKDKTMKYYVGTIDTNLFEKHLVKLMTKHIKQWKEPYAFSGEKEIIDFFNETIERGTFKESSAKPCTTHLTFAYNAEEIESLSL